MAQCRPPFKVKLICGMISADEKLIAKAQELLTAKLGEVDIASAIFPFEHTSYYEAEMGTGLKKYFISFDKLADPADLAMLKIYTNELEEILANQGKSSAPRPINLDPGYLTLSKLILASMKDFSHRVYLADGVYGEVTLQWIKGNWACLPWTFPDFALDKYHNFLTQARTTLADQLKGNAGR